MVRRYAESHERVYIRGWVSDGLAGCIRGDVKRRVSVRRSKNSAKI